MLYIFEMANNHQGSVKHAKKIIDQFSEIAKTKDINAGIKLQFRQLGTFIHKDFQNSDLKYVRRFNSTRLTKEEFREIVNHIRKSGLITIATPFDNESLKWISDFEISVVKVASCSIDDWPLLKDISKINKKIIISTAGASLDTLKKVYNLFKANQRDFAFMHCVGEYPTPNEKANLNRINVLKEEFPDIEIGFSTHESPNEMSLSPHAVAMGCTILEKHVGVETEKIKLNGYSNTPEQILKAIEEIETVRTSMVGISETQKKTLNSLKRGIYINANISPGDILEEEHLYFALPVQEGCYDVSSIESIVGRVCVRPLEKDSPILFESIRNDVDQEKIQLIEKKVLEILKIGNVPLCGRENVEISCHYGLNNFFNFGALIVDKVNREYCKKIIVMLPDQNHPSHHHIKKEESFELLHGDCTLVLNGKKIPMTKGKPILIARGVKHSFSSKEGCIIEEISTTHIPGDSVYEDPKINMLKLEERKIKINLEEA